MVGATTEEYTVWLVAVDRLAERHEEAAQAAGAETPEERADAWVSLVEAPKPLGKLLDAWADGLSFNPGTPADLWPLLVERSSYAMYRALPADAVDALLAHPDWKLRMRAAEHQPNITPEQWARVILAEQDERRRWIVTMMAADRWADPHHIRAGRGRLRGQYRVELGGASWRRGPKAVRVSLLVFLRDAFADDPKRTTTTAVVPAGLW